MNLSRNRACFWSAVACLLLTFALRADADPLILHAHEREKAGDFEASAALLSRWLALNPGASGSPEVFAGYFRMEMDMHALLEVSRQFLVSAKGVPGAARQFDKIARLLDLSGRIEEARNAYLAAFSEGFSESALVAAFLLSFQMNDARSMEESLQKLAGKGGSAEILLRALSDMQTGKRAAARSALIGVADQTGNPDLALKALWILYQADNKHGNTAAASLSRSRLGSRFASAPETAIAVGPAAPGAKTARAVVVEMPTPGLSEAVPSTASPAAAPVPAQAVLEPAASLPAASGAQAAPTPPAAAPDSGTPTTPPNTAAPAAQEILPGAGPAVRVSVQAGSFLMSENADDLVSELARRGFASSVVREMVRGGDRFRVLAGSGLEAEAAKAVLKKLSDEGFRGFIVADK
jgi:cell division septation protein DedD